MAEDRMTSVYQCDGCGRRTLGPEIPPRSVSAHRLDDSGAWLPWGWTWRGGVAYCSPDCGGAPRCAECSGRGTVAEDDGERPRWVECPACLGEGSRE